MIRPTIPRAPDDLDVSSLFADVHWHQRWELFQGVYLPGRNDVTTLLDYAGVPADLSGQRVLDVGAWNGGVSFECERRGAAEVVAYSLEDPAVTGFDRLKAVLASKVEYVVGSVYNLDAKSLGRFDTVIFFGVLYHLRYPLLAADMLRPVTGGNLHIETHVIENCFIPPGQTSDAAQALTSASPQLAETPIWQFYRRGELNNDPSNWFGPNIPAVTEGFGSAGFDVQVVKRWGWRAAFVARPIPAHDLADSYEGRSTVLQRGLGLNFPR